MTSSAGGSADSHREHVNAEIQALPARRDLDNRIAHWRARQAEDQTVADALDDQAGALVARLA
ncbi:hypothetical protein [Actinoplanes sp. NPDC051411]|uniref:hypothetical protein n=1 Tax=Actinoplanes sp. NPDC051411 TaxID=3155522 RepID=UPI003442B67C